MDGADPMKLRMVAAGLTFVAGMALLTAAIAPASDLPWHQAALIGVLLGLSVVCGALAWWFMTGRRNP